MWQGLEGRGCGGSSGDPRVLEVMEREAGEGPAEHVDGAASERDTGRLSPPDSNASAFNLGLGFSPYQ